MLRFIQNSWGDSSMKVYQFEIRIAVPDDADEGALMTRVAQFARECGGDPLATPSPRAEARAIVMSSARCGGDPTGREQWTRQALEVLFKTNSNDVLADHRPGYSL
jgi:hypothetical protein